MQTVAREALCDGDSVEIDDVGVGQWCSHDRVQGERR
jgi:hypothetical protein